MELFGRVFIDTVVDSPPAELGTSKWLLLDHHAGTLPRVEAPVEPVEFCFTKTGAARVPKQKAEH